VEEILRVLPEGDLFRLLRDQILAHSSVDPGKQWASSAAYATYDKRTLTPEAVSGAVDAAFAAGQRLYRELFDAYRAVVEAVARRDLGGGARNLVELGEIFERHHRREHARGCYEKALELGESLADSGPHLLALRRMARLSQSFGELDRAYHFYLSAYNLARDSRNLREASTAATGLGNVKVDQGKWEQAEQHYTTARLHAEEAGDETQLGQLWNNLSIVRRRTGDLEGAMEFSHRAIRVFERLQDAGELSRCYNNLGLVQVERHDFTEALSSYEKAIEHAESAYVVAAVRGNLCDLYLRQERHLLAEEQARLAEEIALRQAFQLILVNVYRLLGELSRRRRDENGVTFFEKALEIAREYHYLHAQAEVHAEYALFRQVLGEPGEALGHAEKALALYRHLDARSDVERVEELLDTLKPSAEFGT
jgi:tetratricopeptide (TPR) repeat protein